jgi:hypothetical protein
MLSKVRTIKKMSAKVVNIPKHLEYTPITLTSGLFHTKGTQKIGDTLFVDGSPYTECGRCGVVIPLTEGWRERRVRYGQLRWINRIFKIVMLVRWEHDIEHKLGPHGEEELVNKCRPIVKSVPGCKSCYEAQEQQRYYDQLNDRMTFFDGRTI